MTKLLIDLETSRIAITENNILKELHIEPGSQALPSGQLSLQKTTSRVGEVLVGRVRTIMPGQFAFIDIGSGKNAFANLKDGHSLKSGQPLLVQVQKDATSQKGAYVSQDINLKGHLLILYKHPAGETGVSHKITDEKESRRLKKLARGLLPAGYGAIVRTNAKNCTQEMLQEEITNLHKKFEEILERANYALPPAKLYPDAAIPLAPILTDILYDTLDEVCISGAGFDETKDFICTLAPFLRDKIFAHDSKLIKNSQIKKALEKTVSLPCGGFITIEQTEACVVVDVNTGNNTNNQSYRKTVLNTNLEAAKVIISQIILRNLSGTIIIDFIDMHNKDDENILMEALAKEAKRDRTNPEIFGISRLGVVQMARPKRRLSLSQLVEVNCPHCGGSGRIYK